MSPKANAEKLRLTPGGSVWISDSARLSLIEPLPEGARVVDRPADADCALVFAEGLASLREQVGGHLAALATVWICYPKGNRADLNRNTIWPVLLECGMRPIAQVSLDDTWSALRFRALEPGEEFRGAGGS